MNVALAEKSWTSPSPRIVKRHGHVSARGANDVFLVSQWAQPLEYLVQPTPEDDPAELIAKLHEELAEIREQFENALLVRAAMRLSEDSLLEVWDNPVDAVYDDL